VLFIQPSQLKSVNPNAVKATKLFYQIIEFDIKSENQNSAELFQVTACNHSNVLTFTLLLSEGRAGEAWEPFKETTLFRAPHNKVFLTFP
jgi:hypothetical protein